MHLLQIDPSKSSDLLLILVTAFILNVVFFYLIIKVAVGDAVRKDNKTIINQLKINNQLKILELVNKGIHPDEIQQEINKAHGAPMEDSYLSLAQKEISKQ